jgi:hypothetical protein
MTSELPDGQPRASAGVAEGASCSSTPPRDPRDLLGEQAMRAFWRDLPQLLQERYRQWVAYHGDRQIGFARTQFELGQECVRQGYDLDEILLRSVEEELPDLVIGTPPRGPQECPGE